MLTRILPTARFSRCIRNFSNPSSISGAKELNKSLFETDPELCAMFDAEKIRQRDSLVLIASENFTSKSCLDALGSIMSNKYSGMLFLVKVLKVLF